MKLINHLKHALAIPMPLGGSDTDNVQGVAARLLLSIAERATISSLTDSETAMLVEVIKGSTAADAFSPPSHLPTNRSTTRSKP